MRSPTAALARRWLVLRWLALCWLALLALGWAVGALIVATGPRFDGAVVAALHAPNSGTLTSAARDVTFLGSPLWLDSVFAGALLALVLARRWRAAVWLTLASPGIAVMHHILEAAVGRPRPLGRHLTPINTASWPSGHAMESTGLYGGLLLLALGSPALARRPALARAAILLTVALLFAIGLSRLLLGVHFPSDVLGGWLLAGAWLAALTTRLRRGVGRRRGAV